MSSFTATGEDDLVRWIRRYARDNGMSVSSLIESVMYKLRSEHQRVDGAGRAHYEKAYPGGESWDTLPHSVRVFFIKAANPDIAAALKRPTRKT